MKSLVAGGVAIGGVAGAVKIRRELRRPQLDREMPEFQGQEATLADVLDAPPFDVCIVGSGPAGTVLGTELARLGLRTVIVEGGVNPSKIASHPRYAEINQATFSGDYPYALTATRAMMPGGSSALWTGVSPRLLPIDFEQNAYTPPGAGWPVTYAHMDPYYERAERSLQVSGESNVRYIAPRSHALADERRGGNRLLKGMLREHGVYAFDTFRSRGPTGGPIRVARDMLPGFVKLPGTAFLSGYSARRLISMSPGRIDALQVRTIEGDAAMIPARVFVVAAGGVESARLLLLSRCEQFPDGPGNSSNQVGRTFNDHAYRNYISKIASQPWSFHEDMPQIVRSFQYYEAFKRRGLGSLGLAIRLRKWNGPGLEFLVTSEQELEPHPSNRITLDPSTLDPWGDPVAHLHFAATERDRVTRDAAHATVANLVAQMKAHSLEEVPPHWGHHHLGIVRMGQDPRTSVVDSNLRLHGVSNAFVLTSGNFVTSGPANPTLLIVAFAHRLAEHVAARMREGAFSPVALTKTA